MNILFSAFSFCRQVNQSISKHNGFLFAKALAFQTLFCILPAIVSILFLAGYINLLDKPIDSLKGILTEQFIPHVAQKALFAQIDIAVAHASSASVFAISIFIFSSFSLVSSIQQIFYQISEQNCHPPFKNQCFVFLLFIVGIITFIISTALLAYLLNISQETIGLSFSPVILKLINFLLVSFMIYCFYKFISPVNFQFFPCFIISFIIGIILLLAQKIFVIYVMWFPGYMLVYGAIAFLPFLFFWLYIYWLVFLYGYSTLIVIEEHRLEDKTK